MSRVYETSATRTVRFKLWSDTNYAGFVEYLHMREAHYDDGTGDFWEVEVDDPSEDIYRVADDYGATVKVL
jgi:hypothetical protein